MEEKKYKTKTSTEVKARYNQKTYKQIVFTLRKVDDATIIEHLARQESAAAYIKKLIINDMKK